MKKLALLLPVLLILAACQNLYTGTVTFTKVADNVMTEFANLYAKGLIDPATDAKIGKAHDSYRASCGVAEAALAAYKTSGDAAAYIAALKAVRASIDPLIDLLTPFIPVSKAETLNTQLAKAQTL